jgi:hypothetical protein
MTRSLLANDHVASELLRRLCDCTLMTTHPLIAAGHEDAGGRCGW